MKRKKKKQLEQERSDRDFGYDGYYNDVEPVDINEQSSEKKDNSSTAIKVSALLFGAVLIISFIILFKISFCNGSGIFLKFSLIIPPPLKTQPLKQ